MYTEKVKKEMEEMKDLLGRIERLNNEAKLYNGEESEPMLYNIEKLQDKYDANKKHVMESYEITANQIKEQFEEKVKMLKDNFEKEKRELEEPYNKKIKEYKVRIAKIEEEKNIYDNDASYVEAAENNISRLEDEIRNLEETEGKKIQEILKDKENDINTKIEEAEKKVNDTMATINKDLKEVGIDVKLFELKEKEKEEQEQEEQEIEGRVKEPINTRLSDTPDISIRYLAETDQYELIDKETNQIYLCNRRDLTPVDKNVIAEKMNVPIQKLKNMNSDIVRILRKFDKINGTHKLRQYRKTIIKTALSKKEMKERMNSIGIQIDYDLRGLYEKDKYTPTEIQEILQNANNAKQVGSGSVKKGIITTIREKVGNVINKIKNIKLLPRGQEDTEYIEEKTNADYWKSIDKEEFKESIKQAHDEKDFREKIETIKAERDYVEMMNPELKAIDRMDKAAKEKLEIQDKEDELER